ncbi:MAG TPA: Xaa-Pro peptidase family protein [Beijerinckiaceae bacterium]|nr:Xaa-Pro peptidase family protein [Beijerinckiaceae bacterium]
MQGNGVMLQDGERADGPSLGMPFDPAKLDRYLDEAGIDVLIATSKHNVRYLLGGHLHHFFAAMDAIGTSRYLPVLVYRTGRPEDAAYIAGRNEKDAIAVRADEGRPLWPPRVEPGASGTIDAMALALEHVRSFSRPPHRIGVEAAFMPWDAGHALQNAFSQATLIEALRPLERLRAVKTAAELERLRLASERVVEAMLAAIAAHGPGVTKRELEATLRREETARGLVFDYGLLTVGANLNRAPSDDRWNAGDILSLDSGGNLDGYIGDLCRMAVLGEPDAELEDLLGEVREIQDCARRAVRAGVRGGEVVTEGEAAVARSPWAKSLNFVAHGMGLVSHEAPRLMSGGPIPYAADDIEAPLEVGMVLSVETTLKHATRGFIKLEDTVAVAAEGSIGFGDSGRGWNRHP